VAAACATPHACRRSHRLSQLNSKGGDGSVPHNPKLVSCTPALPRHSHSLQGMSMSPAATHIVPHRCHHSAPFCTIAPFICTLYPPVNHCTIYGEPIVCRWHKEETATSTDVCKTHWELVAAVPATCHAVPASTLPSSAQSTQGVHQLCFLEKPCNVFMYNLVLIEQSPQGGLPVRIDEQGILSPQVLGVLA
jgi:hypothetical protein